MKVLVWLFLTVTFAYAATIPASKSKCLQVSCTTDLKTCPDGTPAPIPIGECCPSLDACKTSLHRVRSIPDCSRAFCGKDIKKCADGTDAPIPDGECCPSFKTCTAVALDCSRASCELEYPFCPDGKFAPIPVGECCPDAEVCKTGTR